MMKQEMSLTTLLLISIISMNFICFNSIGVVDRETLEEQVVALL